MCERNLDDSIDSCNFSVRGYLPLIQKDSITHMHDHAVYVKEGLPFGWVLYPESSADFYLCFSAGFASLSVLLFPLLITFFIVMHGFDSISCNKYEVLSISPSADVFVFADFNAHHKNWLTYCDGTDRPGEPCYKF